MMPIRRVRAVSLLVGLFLAGCGDATGPRAADIADVIGIYRLEMIEGAALPGLVQQDANSTVHILQGSLELDPNFRFMQTYRTLATQGEQQIDGDVLLEGSFVRRGAELTLVHNQSTRETADIDGEVITLTTLSGLEFVFRKTHL